MLNAEREREIIMKAKSRIGKGKRKMRNGAKMFFIFVAVLAVAIVVAAKGNHREVVGYVYDSGDTVWEMAKRHCPDGMDIQEFAREIEKVNGIKNSTVYKHWSYKIPVYEMETKGEYLDLNTVVGYETTDDGVLLLTNDGNGYLIEK